MRKAFVEPVALPEPRFRDGLGIRYVRTAGTEEPVEVLRPLWDVGSMQNAIRQRVSRLQSFRQARFISVQAAEVPGDDPSTIEVVSDFVAGHRLSQYLEAARAGAIRIDTNAAVYILRELLGALALLRESRGVTHGAVAPERLLVTPKGRIVVADYVLGPAIERLEFTRPRLWREFRVPVPAGKGHPKLDDKADVMQVGVTAMALLLGRPIEPAEFPDGLDSLVTALVNANRLRGIESLPSDLVGWVRRAVFKDPGGKFTDVADARLLLESVISKQDVAGGGAVALKGIAETFGRYAADLEAKAAAKAAEEARQAALAAQAAAMEAIRVAAAEAAAPENNGVPAFTLLSDAPDGLAPGSTSEAVPDPGALPVVESEPPVGWRVPEAPPVEETLPVSPLLQIDAPAPAVSPDDFIEEVLDLTDLTGEDDAELQAAGAALAETVRVEPLPVAEPEAVDSRPTEIDAVEPLEAAVAVEPMLAAACDLTVEAAAPIEELATPAAAEPMVVRAEFDRALTAPEALAAEPTSEVLAAKPASEVLLVEPAPVTEPVAAQPPAVDDVLAALDAQTPPPEPAPDALPEWRLLADPVGAAAPTIEVVEPTETLEELVAEFAAAPYSPEPVSATEEAAPSSLDVVLGLQEAQAAAQATVDVPRPPAEEPPDLAAWSFVEELVHRDARFEARPPVDEPPPEPAAAATDGAVAAVAPASPDPQPVVEVELPKLPADWFIEVGRQRGAAVEPVTDGTVERPLASPAPVEAAQVDVAPALADRLPPAVVMTPAPAPTPAPVVRDAARDESLDPPRLVFERPRWSEEPQPEDGRSGPVFPRVAPSVRRVRAEARRRRWEKVRSAIGGGLASMAGAIASGARAVASGGAGLVAGLGRGLVSALRLAGNGAAAVGSGMLTAFRAGARGLGGVARAITTAVSAASTAAVSGLRAAARMSGAMLAAVARAAVAGGSAAARTLASGSASAGRGVINASAAVARGAVAGGKVLASGIGRSASAAVRVVSASLRAAASGAGVIGGAGMAASRAVARGAARTASTAGRRIATASRASGAGAATVGHVVSRAAVTVPKRVYFFFSDVADRLPRPVVRPWYLAAALVVIVAVAGVPYAKSWLSTHAPDLRARLAERVPGATPPAVPVETPKPPAASAKGTGTIRVTVDPAGADVLLNGMLQGTAPLTIENLTAGAHTLVVRDDSGTVRQSVRVAEGQAVDVSLKIRPGWLAVFAPVKLEVLENGKPIGSTEGGRILTPPGPHTIEVVSRVLGFRETRQVEIKPGEVAAVTMQLPPATVEVAAPAEAEIFVDGEPVGLAPLGPLQVAVGTREFVMRHPAFGERRQVVTVTYNGPARVSFE